MKLKNEILNLKNPVGSVIFGLSLFKLFHLPSIISRINHLVPMSLNHPCPTVHKNLSGCVSLPQYLQLSNHSWFIGMVRPSDNGVIHKKNSLIGLLILLCLLFFSLPLSLLSLSFSFRLLLL